MTDQMPFAKIGDQELWNGEALELLNALPSLAADAVITDPPYCSGGTSIAEKAMDPRVKYCRSGKDLGRPTFAGDARDQRSFALWCTLWLTAARRHVRPGGYCLVFCDWRQLPAMTDVFQAGGFVWRGLIAWNKGRGSRAPHKGYFRHQCEYVIWGTNGPCAKATHGGPWDGCQQFPVLRSDKHHMTGKPTRLLSELVQVAPPGGLILDPFAGSGTTAVACELTGRRSVSIEQSGPYCEIAADRLRTLSLRAA
jgi:site-specific DNA-methyltransferase (adenine-specific)